MKGGKITLKFISCIDQTIHGAWEIYGAIGFRQYYGYTRRDAMRLYNQECRKAKR